ncbi:hypothetical protein CERSUDRAFT_124044 [Gelatoporia subvermispora B]|uniref:Protein kinase domain-containing protein n=1 Tax=Ceriporiopsis subvermispora (strain B) TaxID=914234 RepID=M2RE23_CERS8|nr:hypothetical protein CERSUDRAFT_124044 [Gelatoporia subvermispora B]
MSSLCTCCSAAIPNHVCPFFCSSARKPKDNSTYVTDCAQTAHGRPAHKTGWDSENDGNFVVYSGTIDAYLNRFLPDSPDNPLPKRDVSGAFNKVPKTTVEKDMYLPLQRGLRKEVSDIPSSKRPAFVDTSAQRIPAPFPSLEEDIRDTGPDLSSTLPGKKEATLKVAIWFGIGTVIEIKATEAQDPLKEGGREGSETRRETKRQLAINARNLLHAHLHTHVFIIGIYGFTARIYRFDRAGCIASPSFNYCERPEIFRMFFWRLVHPPSGLSIAGADPTVSQPMASDWKWASKVLREKYSEELPQGARQVGRWLAIPSKDPNAAPERFLAIELRFINSNLFGRATTVWIALRRTTDGDLDDGVKYAVKDSWRQQIRPSETACLERLAEEYKSDLYGLPDFKFGGDLSVWEARQWSQKLTVTGNVRRSPRLVAKTGNMSGDEAVPVLPHITCHQTVSAKVAKKDICYERCHMRFATQCIGRPLSTFSSTKEMVTAIKDAVIGHQNAWNAGVLHRDISAGNVLIVEDHVEKPFKGFLSDFDYSYMKVNAPPTVSPQAAHDGTSDDTQLKQRTGTYHFMSLQILEASSGIKHEVRHDLESFYWLLIWIIYWHTKCTHPLEHSGPLRIFKHLDDNDCADAKLAWFTRRGRDLIIPGNPPLAWLASRWVDLCATNKDQEHEDSTRALTHANVLDMLNTALGMDGWPIGDAAQQGKRPFNGRATTDKPPAASTGQKRRMQHDAMRLSKRSRLDCASAG